MKTVMTTITKTVRKNMRKKSEKHLVFKENKYLKHQTKPVTT